MNSSVERNGVFTGRWNEIGCYLGWTSVCWFECVSFFVGPHHESRLASIALAGGFVTSSRAYLTDVSFLSALYLHPAMQKKSLFMLIAQNITVTINIIKKLRLFEKNETAWKDAELHQIWEGLREEFELQSRFKNLEFVLQLIEHNTKFFLEILVKKTVILYVFPRTT